MTTTLLAVPLQVAACALLLFVPSSLQGQTLGQVLVQNAVTTTPDMAGRVSWPITSYASNSDSLHYAIAYYQRSGDALGDSLHVSLYEKRRGVWLHAAIAREGGIPGDSTWYSLGSAVRITFAPDRLYIDIHLTPSAGKILVLTGNLQLAGMLNGFSQLVLPDGAMVYHKNLVHFAPTHPAELWTFDPRTGRNAALYPQQPYEAVRREYVERVREIYARLGDDWFRINNHHMMAELFESSIGTPMADAAGRRIAFIARFGEGGGSRAATPLVEVLVVCRNLTAGARCTETELSRTRVANPGWSDERILREALSGGG